jgi:hypothetical protein
MQAPPPLQVTVQEFGLWRSLLAVLAAVLASVLGAWCIAMSSFWVLGMAAVLALFGFSAAASLVRIAPFSLRWDTQVWALGAAATRGHEPEVGKLSIAIDLGFWMLLKFSTSAALRDTRWLPVQRRGLALVWQTLRATLYGAKPTLEILPKFTS